MTWAPASTCVRQAWLTLGTLTVGLEGPGWFCSSLDLGYPDARDIVNNKPDQDGVDDRTRLMGSRVVTAEVTALVGAGARVDAVASQFAPFMVPSARPVLHYVLDRPGAAERTMTLRASGYSWPIVGADQRDIQLQWVCSDPIARDPTVQTATAWAGSSTPPGRAYPLAFNRVYPPGSSSPTSAIITTPGDVGVRPRLRVYGPITAPQVLISVSAPGVPFVTYYLTFLASYTIAAGAWVDVDCARKTAFDQAGVNVLAQLDWANLNFPVNWAYIPPLPYQGGMVLYGSSKSGVTQVQATWQDGYLT